MSLREARGAGRIGSSVTAAVQWFFPRASRGSDAAMLSPTHERPTGFVPGVHLKETTQAYIVVADLPGMKRNDVDVEIPLGAKRLVLSGKSFESIIPLQPDVDVNAIEAAS